MTFDANSYNRRLDLERSRKWVQAQMTKENARAFLVMFYTDRLDVHDWWGRDPGETYIEGVVIACKDMLGKDETAEILKRCGKSE